MENKLEWNGSGKLVHNNFGLEHEVTLDIKFNLENINRGNILKFQVKMPGTAVPNPHLFPYENYQIISDIDENNNLVINSNTLFLKEWKEVYLYSYGMKFVSDNLSIGSKENITSLEFYIPNLLIGYDDMSFGEEIINYTDINLNINKTNYLFKLSGNSKFNNPDNFSNLEAQTNFTTKLTVTSDKEYLDYENTIKIVDEFLELLGFAYGGIRPWIMIKGFNEEKTLIWQHIKDINYFDGSNNIPAIPYTFSKEISGFMNDIFPKFYNLNPVYKSEFQRIFQEISKINKKIDFVMVFRNIEQALKFFSIDHQSFKDSNEEQFNDANLKTIFKEISYSEFMLNSFLKRSKEIYKTGYREGDYKLLLQTISLVYKFIFKYFDYEGKYWDWSNVSPIIRENEF